MVLIKKKTIDEKNNLKDYFDDRDSTVKLCKEIPIKSVSLEIEFIKLSEHCYNKTTIIKKVENINFVRNPYLDKKLNLLNGKEEVKPP